MNITVAEPTIPQVVRAALPVIKRLKAREIEYRADRLAAFARRENYVYCVHGNYVGDPFGPDYMCGMCEDGIDIYTEAIETGRSIAQRQLTASTLVRKLHDLRVLDSGEDALADALIDRVLARLYQGPNVQSL